MTQIPLYTVDSFTKKPFEGNPAAVCLIEKDIDPELCQKIAFEINYSETAFVTLLSEKDSFAKSSTFGLRWFTPVSEVDLCGHATLASAAVLFKIVGNTNKEIRFKTVNSGVLICKLTENGTVSMDFPQWVLSKADEKNNLFLEIIYETVDSSLVKDVLYDKNSKNLFLILDDSVTRTQFENIYVNTVKLLAVHPSGSQVKGFSLTLKGSFENGSFDDEGEMYDFLSRYFAPWYGVPEDPVTGSLHCALGPYWSKALGKTTLYARQCSSRGGDLLLNVRHDGRIDIMGEAVILIKGSITV